MYDFLEILFGELTFLVHSINAPIFFSLIYLALRCLHVRKARRRYILLLFSKYLCNQAEIHLHDNGENLLKIARIISWPQGQSSGPSEQTGGERVRYLGRIYSRLSILWNGTCDYVTLAYIFNSFYIFATSKFHKSFNLTQEIETQFSESLLFYLNMYLISSINR